MRILEEKKATEMSLFRTSWTAGLRPFHRHEHLELLIPEDNPIEVFSLGSWKTARRGDIVLIDGGDIHAYRTEADVTILLSQFPYRILLEGGARPRSIAPIITAEEIAAIPFLADQTQALLHVALPEGRVPLGVQNPVMQGALTALFYLLHRHFSRKESGGTEKRSERDFADAVTYVNEHFTEDITVESIARALYTDRGRLSRLFRASAGISLPSYINTLRLGRAATLLEAGATVTAAALESGFQSVRTFHDVFRRAHGTPPKRREKQ